MSTQPNPTQQQPTTKMIIQKYSLQNINKRTPKYKVEKQSYKRSNKTMHGNNFFPLIHRKWAYKSHTYLQASGKT